MPLGSAALVNAVGAVAGSVRSLFLATFLSFVALGSAQSYTIMPETSEARYRITEQLANMSLPIEAVGTTSEVTGAIELDENGAVVSGSEIIVNLSALQSNESRRDNYVRRNTLQTDSFPNAVFVPTELRGLEFPLPETGAASFEIIGDLTLRDVTREVVWQTEAVFGGDAVTLSAVTSFTFEDFTLTKPRVARVLSVEDEIGLEVDFTLQRVPE